MSLRRLLGLREDGLHVATDVNLRVRAPDVAWGATEYDYLIQAAMDRFEALGGPNTISYRSREKSPTMATLQVLTQISQDWCRTAVTQSGNTALFKYASLSNNSSNDAAAIKKNIGYLHLRFLGEVASDEIVDGIFSDVYTKYEPKGADVAWTAVCADLIRHPQFILL